MKENTLVYGVDVGGTTIKFGLLDGRGNLLHRSSIPTDTSEQGRIFCRRSPTGSGGRTFPFGK